jgi:hypothetical protein
MAGFGNDRYDGYQAKPYEYKPAWEKDIDYNPDHRRSDSAMFIEDTDRGPFWGLSVKSENGGKLGILLFHASFDSETAQWGFNGLSTFTPQEIHTGEIDESYMTVGRMKGLVATYGETGVK